MNRDISEQYIAIIADGVIRVFDVLTGEERPVEGPSGWAYLSTATDYAADFDAVTVADYTFVTNRKVTCALKPAGADTTPDNDYQLWLNKTYGVDANGVEFGPGVSYQYAPNPSQGFLSGTVQRLRQAAAYAFRRHDLPSAWRRYVGLHQLLCRLSCRGLGRMPEARHGQRHRREDHAPWR